MPETSTLGLIGSVTGLYLHLLFSAVMFRVDERELGWFGVCACLVAGVAALSFAIARVESQDRARRYREEKPR